MVHQDLRSTPTGPGLPCSADFLRRTSPCRVYQSQVKLTYDGLPGQNRVVEEADHPCSIKSSWPPCGPARDCAGSGDYTTETLFR
jgi:hypothetical protein